MNHQLIRRTADRLRSAAVGSRFSLTADAPESNSVIAVKVLNQALRIAQLTVLRSKRQYRMALRHHAPALAAAALEHANDARLQADRIAERIIALGSRPDPCPDSLPHGIQTQSESGDPVQAVISEHLSASRSAVESYAEFGSFLARFDPAMKTLMDEVAAGEEERGNDLVRLQQERLMRHARA